MKIKLLPLILFSILLCFSCNNEADIALEQEISALDTAEKRKAYLEAIYADDQGVRQGNTEGKEMMQADATNMQKIAKYLEIHGHPKRAEVGETAASTPWAVIHHQPGYNNDAIRHKYFPMLYQAYWDEDIEGGRMWLFLDRMYYIKHDKRFKMKSPYMEEDAIDSLIQMLELSWQILK